MLALGVLATPALTGGAGGLLNGNADLLFAQAIADRRGRRLHRRRDARDPRAGRPVFGLRVSAEEEDLGLDLTQHGQRGYMMGEGELIGIDRK